MAKRALDPTNVRPPARPPFRHPLRVRYSECDSQKVVFNGHYLFYFDVAVTELWREAVGPYEETMHDHGVDIVVAEANVRYHAPLRFDDEFDLVVTIPRLGTTSMITRIACERGGETCAEGELRQVFVRYGTADKTPIPDAIRSALEPYAS